MSLKKLPKITVPARPKNYQWEAPSDVLAKWAERPLAAADSDTTITIYDVIGEDFWTGGGFTAKRMAAALRSIGAKDVTVKINSPGGDMFEGIAIYNELAAHQGKVTIEVMGWAASAASIIAMAGDTIRMGLGTFMMVHCAWGLVIGNRHDFTDAAALFAQFDSAIVDIYVARTGGKREDIESLMDAETFMGPSEAVKHGFADEVAEDLKIEESNAAADQPVFAKRRLDALLAQQGLPRVERRRLLKEATGGTQDAAPTAMHDAGFIASARKLVQTIKP